MTTQNTTQKEQMRAAEEENRSYSLGQQKKHQDLAEKNLKAYQQEMRLLPSYMKMAENDPKKFFLVSNTVEAAKEFLRLYNHHTTEASEWEKD